MTQEAKVVIGIAVATVAILVGAIFFMSKPVQTAQNVERVTDTEQLVGDGKRSIKAEGSTVTIEELVKTKPLLSYLHSYQLLKSQP